MNAPVLPSAARKPHSGGLRQVQTPRSVRGDTAGPAPRAGGFTLVEVVVVLVLLGMVAAVTVPAFRGVGEPEPVDAAAQELFALLHGGRRMAVEEGVRVTLLLDPATGRWWLERGADSLRAGTLDLPPGVRLAAGPPRVRFTFDPSGAVHGDPLAVRGPDALVPVRVDRWSGDVRVQAR